MRNVCGRCGAEGEVCVASWCDPETGEALEPVTMEEARKITGCDKPTNASLAAPLTYCASCDCYQVDILTPHEWEEQLRDIKADQQYDEWKDRRYDDQEF